MDTANLIAFIKVAETGSFSQAAQQLFITQPAVSKRIRQLEQQLDSRLIDRKGKQVLLTQTGQALLPRARGILSNIQDMRQLIADMEGSPMGSLSMATSHHIGLHRLPPILRAFAASYPEVDLDLSFMDSEQACELIEQNVLELAVVTLPFENRPGLEFHKIWDDRLMVTCAKDHPLAQIPEPALQNLVKHPAVLPSHGTFTRQAIETAMVGILPQISINLETNYLETIKMMVSVGLGWSVLPYSMLDSSLVEIPMPDFYASRYLGIIINPDRSRSKATQAMLDCIDSFK